MSRIVISCYDHEDNPYCAGPKAAVVREVARSLSREHEVVVISGSFPGCREEDTEPFQRIFLPTNVAAPQIGKLLFPVMLAGAARRVKHDLWIETISEIPAIRLIPRLTPHPVLALLHPRVAGAETRRHLIASNFAKRDGPIGYRQIITLSNSQADLVIQRRRSTGSVVIPPGIRLPDYVPAPGEGSHILFLGDIHVSHNGLDLLLAAVAAAKRSLPVLIAGAGRPTEERELSRLLDQTSGPIARIGSVPGPVRRALLRDCAFVVLPFRCPKSDLPVLEAMAWGKPVIHFDLPQLDWTAPEATIRVPAFDVNALATAIHGLATDGPRRVIMGQAARKVAEQYSWEQIGVRYLSIVDDCMGRPPCSAGLAERHDSC